MSWPDTIGLPFLMKNIRIMFISTFHKVKKMFLEKIGLYMLLSHSSWTMRPCEGVGM